MLTINIFIIIMLCYFFARMQVRRDVPYMRIERSLVLTLVTNLSISIYTGNQFHSSPITESFIIFICFSIPTFIFYGFYIWLKRLYKNIYTMEA